jgi:HEAT repeat protein
MTGGGHAMKRVLLLVFAVFIVGCGQKSTDDWLRQLKDDDVLMRREAIRELGDCAGEAPLVVPALTEMLRDKNPYVRHDAALSLGKFGPEAREAVPAIKAMLKDKDQTVRHGVAAALQKISGSGVPAGRNH